MNDEEFVFDFLESVVKLAGGVFERERVRSGVGHGGELGFIFGEAAALVVEAGDLAARLSPCEKRRWERTSINCSP